MTNTSADEDDNNDEFFHTTNLSAKPDDHHDSEVSSCTNSLTNGTSSETCLNSMTSSYSSEMNIPTSSLSMMAISSKQSLVNADMHNDKSKLGVRNLLRKLFSAPLHSAHHQGKKLIPIRSVEISASKTYASPVTQGPIRLFVLRHGERLDRYYSSQWIEQAFDKDGNFCRFSPILPETLPLRASFRDFDLDPPLTCSGLKDAYRTGVVLREKNIVIHYCYSSPALRCIQTAAKILEGLQLNHKVKIRIEPGLFECTAWYADDTREGSVLKLPQFMTKSELVESKYNIDRNHREQMNIASISQIETELEYYERSHAVAAAILKMHENELITQIQQGQATVEHHVHILFIGHAPTLETCTRKLCGGKFRPQSLALVIRNVDYLTMTVIEKTDNNSDKWIFRRHSFYGDEV